MNKAPRAFWAGIILCAILCLYFLFFVPTFDLDESLYRRVAEEMKLRGEMWNPTWDTRPLLHKPPILYWLIESFSKLIDGANALVSSTAARTPGFLIAIAITGLLGWTRSLYLWMGAFPIITVCSVIYDPLQTLALLPAILIPHQWFRENREGTTKESLFVALSLFAACAVKGLNGLVIPAIAVVIQLGLQHSGAGAKGILRSALRFGLRTVVPAVIFSAVYYWVLDQKMGRAFTHEFFWVQHFGRSHEAMESHGGGIFYYPIVLALGCGALLPFLVSAISALKDSPQGSFKRGYAQDGYPLTFALTFVVIFTFSATKLPHYLWPAFPALAVFVASQIRKPLGKKALLASFIPMMVFTIAAFAIAMNPVRLIQAMVHSQVLASVLPEGSALPLFGRLGMIAAAALGAVMIYRRERFAQRPDVTFVASSLFYLLFAISVGPFLVERIHKPIVAIADELNALHPPANTCMWYSGPHSPSLSLALGHSVYQKRCEPNEMNFLIAPDWKIAECAQRGMILIAHHGYLNLCEKEANGVGAMSGKPAIPVEQVIGRTAPAENGAAPGESTPETAGSDSGTPAAGDPSPALAGADGVVGTEDDLYLTATAGPDGTLGTEDDVVVTQYVGPDKIGGTADDVPATAAAVTAPGEAPRLQARSKKKAAITHLGDQSGAAVNVLNFVGADGREGTADDVAVVRSSGPDHRLGTADDAVVTQYAGPDQIFGTADDLVVTQTAGPDKTPGTADDVVVTRLAGPDKIAGTADDVPSLTVAASTVAAPKSAATKIATRKPKITRVGPESAPEAIVATFAGPDNQEGTEDDVVVTQTAGPDKQLNTPDDVVTTVSVGPDLKPGTEDDVYVSQQVGPDHVAGTADDVVTTMAIGPDKIAGTEDDTPVTNPLSTALGSALAPADKPAKKAAPRKYRKPKITHLGLGTGNEVVVMNFSDENGKDEYAVTRKIRGTRGSKQVETPVISFPGEDGKLGTMDDVVVTQQVGDDHIAGTMDDVVVTRLAGPDQIAGTDDDVPAGAASLGDAATEVDGKAPGTRRTPRARFTGKSGKVQHLGLGKSNQVTVMNFTSEDERTGRPTKVYVAVDLDKKKSAAKGAKNDPRTSAVTQEMIASLNEMAVTQLVGADKTPGTLDDLVVVKFAGPDGILGTADDVNATSMVPLAGGETVSQYVGPDRIAGTADDVVVVRTAGPDKVMGTADDVVVARPVSEATAAGTLAESEEKVDFSPGADNKPASTKTADAKPAASKPVAALFPKPAVSRTARPILKPVSAQIKPDSPAKIKKAAFERTANTIDWQLERMDYCEAYLCDDKYQSERVIENIETLIDEFPDTQFTAKQIELLNTALIKAIEYRKNWKKYTPDYEIGLMSQEQVNEAIDPLIARLRNVISVIKKRR